MCRDIRNMLDNLELAQINFESGYYDTNKQYRKEYRLPRRETEILITGYDVVRRAAVIDRWFQLENFQRNNIPSWIADLSQEAQVCLNDLSSQLTHQKQLTAQVTAANEDLAGQVDSIQARLNSLSQHFIEGCTIPDFCRSLNGVNIQQVNAALVNRGVLYRSKNGYKLHAYYRNNHFREVKQEFGREGKFRIRIEVLKAGAKWLFSQYADGYLPMIDKWDGHYFHSLA
ncbi:hypothetical protein GLP30_17030 [Photobacterium phosphoreum]|uniref:Antirepressor protein C-terminal domain-containing protein n=1 Tax=Photobacterium phosphoreum TaxID=659 RepID=A0AAW5A2X4_PHOPO|nr:hypothetical protein [Photobacterium phosphoreum]MCF2191792.1 hypothetical protein [Photobacterium phosphoreum]MCF2303474.1 hypothetical protein [Photobacterium phosphoreum]